MYKVVLYVHGGIQVARPAKCGHSHVRIVVQMGHWDMRCSKCDTCLKKGEVTGCWAKNLGR